MVSSDGQDWRVGWYPPAGTPHGAAAVYVSGSRVVLVSSDGCLVTVAEPTVGPIYRRMFVEAGIASVNWRVRPNP